MATTEELALKALGEAYEHLMVIAERMMSPQWEQVMVANALDHVGGAIRALGEEVPDEEEE